MAHQISLYDEIIVDNFAGGGGASTGIELALGRPVDIAINQAAKYRGVSYASLYDAIKHQYTYRGDLWVYCELKVEV